MRITAVLVLTLALAPPARGDEGMWTLNGFPKERVARQYGFTAGDAWLDHLRLSSVRLAQGCSGSFVSAGGLVMTNHHCAHSCIQQLSTPRRDLVKLGFHARSAAEEARCPDLEVNQLVAIRDVTARMKKATEGLEGAAFHEAQRGETARLEAECQTSAALRCDVVALYHGGRYDLYQYRRFQDVRLVFAPELAIAFFGGDPDNFMFPRYDLDAAFLRVYEGGKPARVEHFLRWSAAGAAEGELTFVTGHPGRTSRQLTVAQLEYQRDHALPDALLALAEKRGRLTEYARRGPEQARHSASELFGVENGLKALRGAVAALRDPVFFAGKVKEEQALRARIAADPELAREALPAFEAIAGSQETLRRIRLPHRWLERRAGLDGELFGFARTLVRAAEERQKPSGERLPEYRESALPALTPSLLSGAPIYPELEILLLGHGLAKLREHLGPDHPAVRKALGVESPEEVAARAVKGTKLADPAFRRRLWEGGAAALAAAMRDPMIALAARVDPDARAARKVHDEQVEAVTRRGAEAIARARFALEGTAAYPDATFTLRVSYGQVKGWEEDGEAVPPFTTLAGAFERATGRDPFALPPSWLAARPRLDLATPFNLVTTNDVVGGNSGSPLVNARAEVVGLVFDGNIHSLGGDYGFDERRNRTIAVDGRAMLEALTQVYRADRLVRELRPPGAGAGGP
jgi:hypothetical protein